MSSLFSSSPARFGVNSPMPFVLLLLLSYDLLQSLSPPLNFICSDLPFCNDEFQPLGKGIYDAHGVVVSYNYVVHGYVVLL